MKLLINNIKRQIEQLDSRELKQWLLRHLNLKVVDPKNETVV